MKKNLIILLLMIAFTLGWATNMPVQLSLPDITVTYGDEIIVPLQVNTLTGLGITAYQFELAYDKTKFDLTEVIKQNTLSSSGFVACNATVTGNNIALMFTQSLSGSGTLLKLRFTCLNPGSSPLILNNVIFNSTTITQITNGSITAINTPLNASLSISNYISEPGEVLSIPIMAQNVAGNNCISYQFDLNYNQNTLLFTGTETAGTASQGWVITSNPANNKVSVAGISTIPVTSDGVLLKINFTVQPGVTQYSPLQLSNVVLNTINNVELNNGRVDILGLQNLQLLTSDPLDHVVESSFNFQWLNYNGFPGDYQTIFEIGTDNDWTSAEVYSSGWISLMNSRSISSLPDGITYYVRAGIRNGTNYGSWKYMQFHTNMLPENSQITYPANNQLLTTGVIRIQASERTDTDGDPLTWTWEITKGSVTHSYNTLTPYYDFAPEDNSEYSVRTKFSDGYETSAWTDSKSFRVNYLNDTPTVTAIPAINFNEDTVFSGLDLNQYFADIDLAYNDHLVFSSGSYIGLGIVINQGLVTMTPSPDWFGVHQVIFTATDDSLAEVSTTVQVSVINVNDAPIISLPISFNTDEDAPLWVNFTTYISDIDNTLTELTISSASSEHIGLTIQNKQIRFMPAMNWFGSETFEFTVSDGHLTHSDQVTLIVNPVNDAPVISLPASFSTDEDTPLILDLSVYLSDVDNSLAELIISSVSSSHIGLNINNKIVTFTPQLNWSGTESFNFMVNDGSLYQQGFDQVSIIVNPMNDAPMINLPLSFNISEDTPYVEDFSPYLSDIDNTLTELTLSAVSSIHVTVGIVNKTVTFTPALNWSGSESISFQVNDNVSRSHVSRAVNTGSVVVNVLPVNDAPVISLPAQINLQEDIPLVIDFTPYISDLDNSLSELILSGNSSIHISVSINNKVVTLTPTANWNGYETLSFSISDGVKRSGSLKSSKNRSSSSDDLIVFVQPVNDRPNINLPELIVMRNDSTKVLDFTPYLSDIDNSLTDLTLICQANPHIITQVNRFSVSLNSAGWYGMSTLYFTVTDLQGSSQDSLSVQVIDSATLPVELSSFSFADISENSVQILWVTQSENNIIGYNLFRSMNENINQSIRINNSIIHAGNSSQEQHYLFPDSELEASTIYYYWLQSVENNGITVLFGPYILKTMDHEQPPVMPQKTMIKSLYPNPLSMSSGLNIELQVQEGEEATLSIYNIKGQLVKKYPIIMSGYSTCQWNGKDISNIPCSSGAYFIRFSSPTYHGIKKIMLMK